MKFKNLYDMHTHSIHSFDGNDSCMQLCESAASLGAAGIAVTDHCDIDGSDMDENALCSAQLEDLRECRRRFQGKLDVFFGLEIGQGIYRRERTQRLLDKFDYDFILGSLHNLENMEDFYFLDYDKYDVKNLMQMYFEGILELVQWGEFDSLAHLTYPFRYIAERGGSKVEPGCFDGIIDLILETLAKKNKALEINTSGLFMPLNDTLPNIKYVKRFHSLGGKYVTVGSDSHYASRLFQGIEAGCEIALESGFEHVTVFKKRCPVQIKTK